MGLDIGPETVRAYAGALRDAKTVVWNGPMGVFEIDAFAQRHDRRGAAPWPTCSGTTHRRRRRLDRGGERRPGVADRITHISTGGGASLEFLGGRTLPGVAALPDK